MAEYPNVAGCDDVPFGGKLPMFHKSQFLLLRVEHSKENFLLVLDSKADGIMTHRNVGKYLSDGTTSCLGTSGALAFLNGIATDSSEQVSVLLALYCSQFTSRPNGRFSFILYSPS